MEIKEYLDELLGDGFFLDEALVVGPYPSPGFFDQLLDSDKKSRPGYPRTKLTVVADDGWDQVRLDGISKSYQGRQGNKTTVAIRRVSPEKRQGLVHAKLYFFKLRNEARTYSRRILLVGSANASNQGFGMHAETYVSVDLSDIDDAQKCDVVDYLQALENGQNAPSIWFSISQKKDSWIMLPAINSVPDHEPSGFDAWLRRGRLCHKYQRDQTFGKLTLRLRQPLPKSELERGLINFGFGADLDSQTFSRSYVSYSNESGNEQNVVLWRKRYFVETYFGHWVSAECFDSKQSEFTEPRADERKEVISLIERASATTRTEWLDEFEMSLKNMANVLAIRSGLGESRLGDFLELDGDHVNIANYRSAAKGKLEYDRERTNDPVFAARFSSGYAFPRMPQLGEDFDDFARDFCQNLLSKIRGRRVSNRIAEILKEHFQGAIPQTAEELLFKLRSEWDSLGTSVVDYYKDSNEANDW